MEEYTIGWSLFPMIFCANKAPTTNNDASTWTWNSTSHFGAIKIGASIYNYFILFFKLPSFLTLLYP
jgi:hypothetical protein